MAKLLGIGNATLDVIHTVDGYPLENDEVRALDRYERLGGNTANTLVVLAQLGIECSLAATLTDSRDGARIREELTAHGVDIGHCHSSGKGSVPVSSVLVNIRNGSRTIIHHRDLPEYSAHDFESVNPEKFDWVHFEGRNVGETRLMIERLRRLCPAVPVSVEIEKPRDDIESLFMHADVLLFSRTYAQARGYQDPLSLLRALQPLSPRALLVCAWADLGAAAIDSHGEISRHAAVVPDVVVDTLGAGDTFNAGIISACMDGLDASDCLARACLLAGRKCAQAGFDGLGPAGKPSCD